LAQILNYASWNFHTNQEKFLFLFCYLLYNLEQVYFPLVVLKVSMFR